VLRARFREAWLSNPKADLLSGLVVALALIPEAISFSIIAGVDPKVGLYASFSIAIIISMVGGRAGMISAATGAMALVIVPLVEDYGVEYLFAATVLAGALQVLFGYLRVGNLMRFIPRTVMLGFVNALAILIFLAQIPHIILKDGNKDELLLNLAFIAAGLAIIYCVPRLTKIVPSPLVAISVLAAGAIYFDWSLPTVGDMGELPNALPGFALPEIPYTWETLSIIFPFSLTLAFVGLLESLLTAQLLDDMTDTNSDKNQESRGQGIGNVLHRFFRRHGWMRHDRPIDDQPSFGRPDPIVDACVRRLPTPPHHGARRLRGADPDGSARGSNDHGRDQHVQLEKHHAKDHTVDAEE
jgi:SulP family sulfate permease